MKKLVALFLLYILSSVPMYSMALDQATFKVGQKFFEKKLYLEAEKRFLDIVQKYPDSTLFHSSLYYLGQSYAHMGKYKSALHFYRLLLDKAPSIKQRQQAILGVAKSWLQLGQHKKSGDFYSFFVSEYPESQYAPAALYFAGIARERDGNNNSAIEKYRAVLDSYPQSTYYSQSIEKIAMLTSTTPETLWVEDDKSPNAEVLAKQYEVLPKDPMVTHQKKYNNVPHSTVNSTFDSQYKDSQYKAQLSQNMFMTEIEPIGYPQVTSSIENNYSDVQPQWIQNTPATITQLIQSEPVVITQQIESAPTVLTQKVIQVVTQHIEAPSEIPSTIDNVKPEVNYGSISLKQQELETYKKIWEEEYQLKLRKQELQTAKNNIKQLAELSSEKAQILQVKENALLEKQNQLNNTLYSDLAKISQQTKKQISTPMISNTIIPNNTPVPTVPVAPVIPSNSIEEESTYEENNSLEDINDYTDDYDSTYTDDSIDDTTYETDSGEEYSYNEYAQ